jgi:hypothetical protein
LTEKLYTLAEARRELARRECDTHGHDIDFMHQHGSTDPIAAFCTRDCGHQGWRMTPVLCTPDHPTAPAG